MNEKKKASILRIILVDYMAFIGTVIPLVFFGLFLLVNILGYLPGFRWRDPIPGTGSAPTFLILGLVGLVLGWPLAFWRIKSIQRMFAAGQEVLGQIKSVAFFRDRGRLEFVFSHQEKVYSGGCGIMKTARTRSIQPGMKLVLLIDPQNPTKGALVRDLYL